MRDYVTTNRTLVAHRAFSRCVLPEKVLITRLTTQKWLDVGQEWTVDEYRSAHAQMQYEYRVRCVAHYYGKGCENLCRPRDDNFGHYSCSPTGERVCLTGWKGDYCNTRKFCRGASRARRARERRGVSHRDCTGGPIACACVVSLFAGDRSTIRRMCDCPLSAGMN